MNILPIMLENYWYKCYSVDLIIKILNYYKEGYNFIANLENQLLTGYNNVDTKTKIDIINYFYNKYNESPNFIIKTVIQRLYPIEIEIQEFIEQTYPDIFAILDSNKTSECCIITDNSNNIIINNVDKLREIYVIYGDTIFDDKRFVFCNNMSYLNNILLGCFNMHINIDIDIMNNIKEICNFLEEINRLDGANYAFLIEIFDIFDKLSKDKLKFVYNNQDYEITRNIIHYFRHFSFHFFLSNWEENHFRISLEELVNNDNYPIIKNINDLLKIFADLCEKCDRDICDLSKNYDGYFDESKINYFFANPGNYIVENYSKSYNYFIKINNNDLFSYKELKEFYDTFSSLHPYAKYDFQEYIFKYIKVDYNDLESLPIKDLKFIVRGYFNYIETIL